jgi:pilus assembly protein CpaE
MYAYVVNCGHPDRRAALLEQLLEKLGYVISRKDTFWELVNDPSLKAQTDTPVLILAAEGSQTNAAEVIGLANKLKGRAFVIYVADEISQADYKALVRTGVADCVGWDSAHAEISEIWQRKQAGGAKIAPSSAEAGRPHIVVGFLGTAGGVGNTTMALETGIYLASLKGENARRTAVIDLDFQRSVMCDYVNLPARLDMANFIRNPQRLDPYMLDIFTSKHQSGLDILACENNDADYSSMDGSAVFSLLDQLTERYDTVLLDAPRWRLAWLAQVLMNSDFVFVTGRYSVPSVKQIAYELRQLRALELPWDRVGVIINWCQTNLFGGILHTSAIQSVLANQRVFYVRQDSAFALERVNIGSSIAEAGYKRGMCRDIKTISEAICAMAPRVTT